MNVLPAEAPAPLEPGLSGLVDGITRLPPLPEAIAEVMLALGHSELSARRCIGLIEHDQALAASTLRLANSAFYGVPGHVGSIADAVRLLGLRTVSGLLTAVAVHDALQPGGCAGFPLKTYWRHAVGTAVAARALAPVAARDSDEAFLAGLLCDVGQLVLAKLLPRQTSQVGRLLGEQGLSAVEAEQAVFGTVHPQVGAQVARRWHFPGAVVQAIEFHHLPLPPAAGERCSLSGLIQGADAIAHAFEPGQPAETPVAIDAATVWQQLGQAAETLPELLARIERDTREICELLHAG